MCCIMMFRWINQQPGIQKFWNGCSHYQDIYDWISPSNKWSDSWFILTQQILWGNEYGKSILLSINTSLKHLMMHFEVQFFQGFIFLFYTLLKTLIACRAMHLRFFFKLETLLNNAFNDCLVILHANLYIVDKTYCGYRVLVYSR